MGEPLSRGSSALCAVIADDEPGGADSGTVATMITHAKQIWSQEGSIDDAFAPQMYQNTFTSTNGSSALYVISQNGDFKGTKDKCGVAPSFVISCCTVARAEVVSPQVAIERAALAHERDETASASSSSPQTPSQRD